MSQLSPEVARRLDEESVGWLTSVSAKGQPQSSLVWFLHDGDDLLIYSRSHAGKLANIAANPRVAFNLRSDEHGDSVTTIEAAGTIDFSPTRAHEVPAYLAKYAGEIAHFGWTPTEFAELYPVLIRLVITRVRT